MDEARPELPELPSPAATKWGDEYDEFYSFDNGRPFFTAEQMREYARAAVLAERERIESAARRILDGIDDDECSRNEGWWETSTGANFGAERLALLVAAIRQGP